jgi:hypothetical protein
MEKSLVHGREGIVEGRVDNGNRMKAGLDNGVEAGSESRAKEGLKS